MSQASHNHPQPSSEGATPEPTTTEGQARLDGRYRFCAGRPVNPDEGVHPEMRTDTAASNSGRLADSEAIPSSPAELIAMQDKSNPPRPEKPNRQTSVHVTQVMELIDKLDTKAAEDLEIALRLVRRLESFHDEVVDEMRGDADASHNQLISWAIDADRLMQARILLENVDLA